jgi:hypothetical protein
LTLNGVTKPLIVWSRELGISYETLRWRMKKGLPAEEILATGVKSVNTNNVQDYFPKPMPGI